MYSCIIVLKSCKLHYILISSENTNARKYTHFSLYVKVLKIYYIQISKTMNQKSRQAFDKGKMTLYLGKRPY